MMCKKSAMVVSLACWAWAIYPFDYKDIGNRIWYNESKNSIEKLVFWNGAEEFPSLGIGHFIWYPDAYNGPFEQAFPLFLSFCSKKGINLPDGLTPSSHAPWATRQIFLDSQDTVYMKKLRNFLENTIALQAEFMVTRMKSMLPDILDQVKPSQRPRFKRWLKALSNDTHGLYVLVDYSNFKGSGLSPKERYDGNGWGLLYVLQEMHPRSESVIDLCNGFADAAERVLERRVMHAPIERNEKKFLPGWLNRIKSYRK